MRRALPLHTMVPGASLDGMALAEGALSPSKVAQHIKEAMEPSRGNISSVEASPNVVGTKVHRFRKFPFPMPPLHLNF